MFTPTIYDDILLNVFQSPFVFFFMFEVLVFFYDKLRGRSTTKKKLRQRKYDEDNLIITESEAENVRMVFPRIDHKK